jgi:hypothetical protein
MRWPKKGPRPTFGHLAVPLQAIARVGMRRVLEAFVKELLYAGGLSRDPTRVEKKLAVPVR